jgi:hypothetical protein
MRRSSPNCSRPDDQTNYRLADGSEAHVQPDGKVIAGISWLSSWQATARLRSASSSTAPR